MNIIPISGILYVTDKETFPTKPESCQDWEKVKAKESPCGLLAHEGEIGCVCDLLESDYDQAVADFIRDCTPICEEDQEKVLWYLTTRSNHSEWSWAFQGAKAGLKLAPLNLSPYQFEEQIKEQAAKELQEGPVRNEYWLVYLFSAQKFRVDHTIYKVEGLELEECMQFFNVDKWFMSDPNSKREPWKGLKYRRAFRIVETKEESTSKKFWGNVEKDLEKHKVGEFTPEELKDYSKHGFWNGKPNSLKTLVWKLDREIWAKVEAHEATQSWGRQESARLILEYMKKETKI